MAVDKDTGERISEASQKTSDPKRAGRNLLRFVEINPDRRLEPHTLLTAKLFAASQFLANYCIANPDELFSAIRERKKEITRRLLQIRANKELVIDEMPAADHDGEELKSGPFPDQKLILASMMKALRVFKKRYLLRITLRDLSGEADIQSSMDELTLLAETIISTALVWSLTLNRRKYGSPSESAISIIALGKLGGQELNYSSDVDLIAVYTNDEGQTSGTLNPSGIMFNRIGNHEFFCKVMESFSRLLSSHTEDGIGYRVDLRLRPQGQKGDIALPLKAYRTYYESWGRTWERMMLIRARPVAGDMKLGEEFIDTIRPFVWREAIDFSEIEEIRALKKKIDSTYSRDDIKRGYGGIREAEFFVQTFQLLFGGETSSLRSYRILNAIQALKWMKKVPEEDLTTLWDNYLYLRRVEHYLQMKEDLQTHMLPSSEEETVALSRQMGFPAAADFLANLSVKRMQIKSMYNSLLGSREDVYSEALNLIEGGLKDYELAGYLSFRKVKHPERCVASLNKIRDHMRAFRTMQERSTVRDVIPRLIENALRAESPDRAIAGIESLFFPFGIKTAHLTAFIEQKELMTGVVKLFSMSPFLTRIFLSGHHYLDMLIEEWGISRTLEDREVRLKRLAGGEDVSFQLARYRRSEEVRMGMLFLLNILTIEDLFRGLSQVAEAIIKSVIDSCGFTDLAVIALGKLGAGEMTFGSDLDIVFVSESPDALIAAEKIVRTLTTYTDLGQLYSVDTRLRPDGSKGVLVNNIDGYRNYYLKKAQNWELQALLKARPVGGSEAPALSFMNMTRDVILEKGRDVRREDISATRLRIIKELSRESEGIDIKLGPGGIEEIEFYVQFLQLHNADSFPDIMVQDTLTAISRLGKINLISQSQRDRLQDAYRYFRKLETFLRLNEADVISSGSDITEQAAAFMGHESEGDLLGHLNTVRNKVLEVVRMEGQ